jgi:hypothetical protein
MLFTTVQIDYGDEDESVRISITGVVIPDGLMPLQVERPPVGFRKATTITIRPIPVRLAECVATTFKWSGQIPEKWVVVWPELQMPIARYGLATTIQVA